MTDFIKSFEKGLDAAKTAEQNRNEMKSVFEELNQQLDRSTDGKLYIERRQFFKNSTFQDLPRLVHFQEREKYTAVAATNKKIADYKDVELAIWKEDRNGYPCQIIYGDEDIFCEDKTALENGIKNLLRDPSVGDKLYKVMNATIPISPDPDEEEQA